MCSSSSNSMKYTPGGNLIDRLFIEYQENHEKTKSLVESISEKPNEVRNQLQEWRKSVALTESFWRTAAINTSSLDSSNTVKMNEYLKKKQADFKKQYAHMHQQDSIIEQELKELQQELEMFTIKAAHSQLLENIKGSALRESEMQKMIEEIEALTKKLESFSQQEL